MKIFCVTLQDSEGTFVLPDAVEVDSMQHVVVYDSDTSCLQGRGNCVKKMFGRHVP